MKRKITKLIFSLLYVGILTTNVTITNATNESNMIDDYSIDIENSFNGVYTANFDSYNISVGYSTDWSNYGLILNKTDSEFNTINRATINDYDPYYIENLNFYTKTNEGILIQSDDYSFIEYDKDLNFTKEHYIDLGLINLDGYEIFPINVLDNKLIFTVLNLDDQILSVCEYNLENDDVVLIEEVVDVYNFIGRERNGLAFICEGFEGNFLISIDKLTNQITTENLNLDYITELYDFNEISNGFILKYDDGNSLKLAKIENNSVSFDVSINEYINYSTVKSVIFEDKYYALNTHENVINVHSLENGDFIKSVEFSFSNVNYTINNFYRRNDSFYIELMYTNNDYIEKYGVVKLNKNLLPTNDEDVIEELTIGLSTNQISFNNYTGLQDMYINDLTVSISSSSVYDLGVTMTDDIRGIIDNTLVINSNNLQVKLEEEDSDKYRGFTVGEKEMLLIDSPSGVNITHKLSFRLLADTFLKEDNYSTILKFEVNQK